MYRECLIEINKLYVILCMFYIRCGYFSVLQFLHWIKHLVIWQHSSTLSCWKKMGKLKKIKQKNGKRSSMSTLKKTIHWTWFNHATYIPSKQTKLSQPTFIMLFEHKIDVLVKHDINISIKLICIFELLVHS